MALVTPVFIPRWFSFLYPFYAAFMVEGIFALSRSIRAHPNRAAVAITAVALLYNLAALDRYYFDPTFHPYQWRTAAAAIEQEIKPGDVLLFGDHGNETALGYYFRTHGPSMVLLPRPDFEAIQRLGARHGRVWLVIAPPADEPAMLNQTMAALRPSFVLAGKNQTIPGVYPWVYLFEAKLSPPH